MNAIKRLKPIQKRFIIIVIIVMIIGAFVGVRKLTTSNNPSKNGQNNTISNQESAKTGQDNNTGSLKADNETKSTDNKKYSEATSDDELVSPHGNFVSSHKVSLSAMKDAKLESICNTTPGASCIIEFKKDGVTRALSTRTANNNGNVTWNWSPQEINIGQGSWKIVVTAQFAGRSTTVTDLQNLEVSP